MTTTFDASLGDDVSIVRFHIGDTNVPNVYLQDETIQARLTEHEDSVEETVIDCIQFIIAQLSIPNFSKDWLSVNVNDARQAYEVMLTRKRQEFGIRTVFGTSTISLPGRYDADDYDYDEEDA